MRKLFSSLLAMAIMMAGVLGVAAQDAGNSYADGIGSTAVWTDDRGNEVATLSVIDVEEDWSDYDDRSAPARGYLYHAVTFEVTNTGGGSVALERNRFSLVDNSGMNGSASRADVAEGSATTLLTDDEDVAEGETAEYTLVFELFADVTPSLFVWQPDSGRLLFVNVGDGSAETNSAALGLNTPATWVDERGEPVASLEVVEVDDDWQDYGEYEAPDRGSRYVAVTFVITNLSSDDLEVAPFDLSLLDSESANNGRSYAQGNEDVEDLLFTEDVTLAAGESVESTVVYELFGDADAVAFIWQPDWGYLNVVVLDADAGSSPDATPAEDEVDATPAA